MWWDDGKLSFTQRVYFSLNNQSCTPLKPLKRIFCLYGSVKFKKFISTIIKYEDSLLLPNNLIIFFWWNKR
jgi:hypothetical protein